MGTVTSTHTTGGANPLSKDHQTIITKKGNFYYLTTKELEDDSAQTVGEAKSDQAGTTKTERRVSIVAEKRPGPS
jgi:hypothetical protein